MNHYFSFGIINILFAIIYLIEYYIFLNFDKKKYHKYITFRYIMIIILYTFVGMLFMYDYYN